tara:strand:- start:110 stop:646 length:537 start_codon:yes stop_codon:yes gene_type:complete
MAIKKIAYDTKHLASCGITFDTEAAALKHLPDGDGGSDTADSNWKVFDVDHDPATDYLLSYELNAAGDALVNPFAGKTIAEQTSLVVAREFERKTAREKGVKKHQIKILAGETIEGLEWKINRAKDIDAINGNNNALRAVYQEREDIRVKSNAAEAEVDALTTYEEVCAYDPRAYLTS